MNTQDNPPANATKAPDPPGYEGWQRRTAAFLAGQAVSLFGSSLVMYAMIWYVTLKTQSGVLIAVSTLCSFAPQIVISLFAGVWADRYNRKKLIIYADAGIAVATLALAVAFLLGRGELWMLFTVAAVRSLGSGIQSPAISAMLPQLVPPDKLMRANGIQGTVQSVVMLGSPAAAGALYALARLEILFFLDVVTAAIAITILLAIPIAAHAKALEAQNTGYLDDLKAGIAYVRGNCFVRSMLRFFAVVMFLAVPVALLSPLMVTRTFGPDVWRLTASEMLFSGGMTVGGLLVAAWGGFKNRILTLMVSCVALGVLTLAVGLAAWFWFFLALMALTGLVLPFYNSASMVLLQQRVPADMQGRVFSFVSLVTVAAMPIGSFLFGPLADLVSIEALLIVTGVGMAVAGVVSWFDRNLHVEPDGPQPGPQDAEAGS